MTKYRQQTMKRTTSHGLQTMDYELQTLAAVAKDVRSGKLKQSGYMTNSMMENHFDIRSHATDMTN